MFEAGRIIAKAEVAWRGWGIRHFVGAGRIETLYVHHPKGKLIEERRVAARHGGMRPDDLSPVF